MNKRKVLFVITKSNWGGAQRYVFDLATSLREAGFEAVVALGGTGTHGAHTGVLAEKLAGAGVRTMHIPSFMRDISFGADIKSFFELYRLYKKEMPDVVHLNSSKAGGVGALAARLAGIETIVFTVHGLPWDENRNFIAKSLIYIATRATFVLSHKVICITLNNYTRARACLLCRNKIHLIYNGIDLQMQFGSGDIIRQAFLNGVKITGTVGELTKNKNQIALIEEARNNPSMYVALVGEGELRPMLEKKIKEYGLEDRVKLFGFQSAPDVIKGFDVFALPSIKEGLPYVLLEARAAGLPIVANRVGGVGEALDKPLSEFSKEKMTRETLALY